MDPVLPHHVNFCLAAESKHDCFFIVGPDSKTAKRIGAIKIFLIMHSEPFTKMLDEGELVECGDVRIPDVMPETFRIFLQCVYGGHESVIKRLSFTQAADLFCIVDKYLVVYLRNDVVQHLLGMLPLNVNNIFITCSKPVVLIDDCLKQTFDSLVQKRTKEIFTAEEFLNLSEEGLSLIVAQNSLSVNEISIWEAVLKWAKHQTQSNDEQILRVCIANLLKSIRFCTMNNEDFCSKVLVTGILNSNEVKEICKSFVSKEPPRLDLICNSVIKREIARNDIANKKTVVFTFNVNDLKTTNWIITDMFECGAIMWYLKVNSGKKLGVYLCCKGHCVTSLNWECLASAEFELFSRTSEAFSRNFLENKIFSNNKSTWGFESFISWDQLYLPENGYLKNNNFIVEVCLTVHPATI